MNAKNIIFALIGSILLAAVFAHADGIGSNVVNQVSDGISATAEEAKSTGSSLMGLGSKILSHIPYIGGHFHKNRGDAQGAASTVAPTAEETTTQAPASTEAQTEAVQTEAVQTEASSTQASAEH